MATSNPSPGLASLTLPSDLRLLPVAVGFAREYAAVLGFEGETLKAIALGVEEAVSNVVQHAFAADEDAEFSITCEPIALGIKTTIRDKGLPFDPEAAPVYEAEHVEKEGPSGLGLYLMRQLLDEVSFHILGREGKEVQLIKYLDSDPLDRSVPPDPAIQSPEPSGGAALSPASIPFDVRLAEPHEAIEIAKCAYDAYEYSYGHEQIYYPQRTSKLIESGTLVSAIAETRDEARTIMAHNALLIDDPDNGTAEMGMAFTKKQFQKQGCSKELGKLLLSQAVQRGLNGIFLDCTTSHIYTQKAAIGGGARECCILLGIDPEAQNWRDFSSQSQRGSSVIAFLGLPPSTNTGLEKKPAFPPPQHRTMIQGIYKNLAADRALAEPGAQDELASEALSIIQVSSGGSYQQTASIRVESYGKDCVQQVGMALKRLCVDKFEVIYLYLNLADPLTAKLTADFEDLGFFFAGLIPRPITGDILELQYLNNVRIAYDRIQLYSDFAKQLLTYIQDHDPTHGALAEP